MSLLRHLLIGSFFFSGLPLLKAQQAQYHLKGFMGVQGGESFTYKLELRDSTQNLLTGYAYTYLDEKHDVKADVVATVDRSQKTLLVRERNIVYNNYFKSNAIICLVEALLTYSNKERNLSGPLITMTAGNGASCSKGSITFANAEELDQVFNPVIAAAPGVAPATKPVVKPVITPGKQAKIIYDTLPKQQVAPLPVAAKTESKVPDNITEGKDKSYNWQSEQIVMEIWDGNEVDNDKITVLLNGNEVLKSYSLVKAKKKLILPVGGNELNIITIVADNEGGDPPNTANIRLWDNDIAYDVIAHNAVGKKALIKIRKK